MSTTWPQGRSRELWFLSPKPRLTDVDLRLLTAVDQQGHVAVVASTAHGDQPIGIGRLIRDRDVPESAELALAAVVDSWHRRGVGTLLMRSLAHRAVEIGVRRLTVLLSHDNRAVLRMLARVPRPVSLVQLDPWTTEYAISLDATGLGPRFGTASA
jgi:GNAT superfamily N-acetyltransferase